MEKSNHELLEDLGISLRNIRKQGKTLCPKCSHTRKNKKDPCLGVNIDEGWYRCHNCDWSGTVKGRYEYSEKPKEYVRPAFVNRTQCSEPLVNWFFGRGITQQTLIDLNVTENQEWMPQNQQVSSCINFNYFRDGILINTKFRNGLKHFKMVSQAELIFYNIDSIKDTDSAIIVEGEIDALSFHQAGIKNVISVPNGASSSNNPNLDYLDNCIEYFHNKNKIILATDSDAPGMSLREELARRIGYHKCYKVDFEDCKDANEYLQKYGSDKLKDVVSDSKISEFPIRGIITVDDVWNEVDALYTEGLQRGDTTGSIREFDKKVSFVPGHTMVITGIPNHGKSPFALMIMCCLSVNRGWKWAVFSPEHKPLSIFIAKMCEMMLGKRMRQGVGFTDREKQLSRSFLNDHFFFIEPDDDNKLESIISSAESLVSRKGIKGMIIDPWNKIEHNFAGDNETMYVSKALDKIISFSQTNHVFGIIIAHPTKIRKRAGKDIHEVPTLYDIAGSSNWFNKPDWGITFYRNFETGNNEIYVQKAKWEHLGSNGFCEVKYNMNNGRFSDVSSQHDNANWLVPKTEQADMFAAQQEQINFSDTPSQDKAEDSPF